MSDTLSPSKDPVVWHRTSCWVTDRINLTGDLHHDPQVATGQLEAWVTDGITDVLDVRGEASDERFVAHNAPDVTYRWLGTHDDGGQQSDAWFDAGTAAGLAALARSDGRLVVHCHMGINRGPSIGFAILLALGWDPLEALDAIRAARPIAKVLYAGDAISWWLRRNGASPTEVSAGVASVNQWHHDNPLDLGWVISRIRFGGPLPGGN